MGCFSGKAVRVSHKFFDAFIDEWCDGNKEALPHINMYTKSEDFEIWLSAANESGDCFVEQHRSELDAVKYLEDCESCVYEDGFYVYKEARDE